MSVRATVAAVMVFLGTTASPLAAQTREGFVFSIGGGAGWADVSCPDCGSTDRNAGGVGFVTAGWALNPHVVIGGELDVWVRRSKDAWVERRDYRYNASAVVLLYPSAQGGFFVKGGGGVSYEDQDVRFGDGDAQDFELGNGPGLVVGVGYDIPVGRVALTPAVTYWAGWLGDLTLNGRTYLKDRRQDVLAMTLGVTFR